MIRSGGMDASPEFRKLCEGIFQGAEGEFKNEHALVDFLVSRLDDGERKRLGPFLDELVDPRLSGDEVQRVWNSTRAEIAFFNAEDARAFLRLVRKRIG
jgi:hypothetical protein